MKLRERKIKKCVSGLLAVLMLFGTLGTLPGRETVVYAAGGNEPSVTAYATKQELMDTFMQDGNNTTIGKLVFGRNNNDEAMEWYILGKDAGVTGDNIAIFAAKSMGEKAFEMDVNNKAYDTGFGVYSSNPSEVYPNHYGASDIRATLQEIATSKFTVAEQSFMQATTITTYDCKNDMEYTTTDKLYLPMIEGQGITYRTLKAGTNNDKLLPMNIYWKSGSWFWTRSAETTIATYALAVFQGGYGFSLNVDYGTEVYPAANLDVSSVAFASAARAASSEAVVSGIIQNETAMILRMDGSSKDIGTVIYDEAGTIKATKGSVTEPVALVVQGNDGTKDWYYSKQITGQETVRTGDIKDALGLSEDIVLSDCKIWLETTEDRVTYAVDAVKMPELISITNPQPITGVKNGVDKTVTAFGLPTMVTIVTEAADITTAEVTWDLENPVSGSYDKAVLAAQTFTVKGVVTLPEEIANSHHIPLEVMVTVTVNAADTVEKPTADLKEGIYNKEQSVTLTSSTKGAVIYYTTDGSEPGITNGTRYTKAIKITGKAGDSVTTEIRAIAVKSGMLDSQIATFKYTIELPANVVQTPDYQIIDGADSVWEKASNKSLTFTGNGDFNKFTGVKVDGELLDPNNYIAKEGSTIITLKADYLDKLSTGKHTLEILWSDGSADTTFTVQQVSTESSNTTDGGNNVETPKTGDASNPAFWIIIMLAAVAGIVGLKKRTIIDKSIK